jgi:PAS domain S-box-containing protein
MSNESREDVPTPAPVNAPLPVLGALAGIIGRPGFAIAVSSGLLLGFVILPASDRGAGVLIALGALCIAALTARWALKTQTRVEGLQQKLLDEASYHAFVDAAIEGFFRTTRGGTYLIVNPALARIYGYESPEQLQREITDIGRSLYLDPNRRAEFLTLMAQDGRVLDFISQIRRRDGSVIWIVENARTVTDDDGQFLYYEGTVGDVTGQRESEDATRRALAETQEAVRAKAAFLAAMSHELKTPLNAILGFSDLIQQELFGPINEPRYRSYITDIHMNGQHLLAKINDILDLSRIEGRLLDIDDHAVSIGESVAAACDSVKAARGDMAPIEIHIPTDLPLLRADPRRLQQVLGHLLSNAAKFTRPEGRIEVNALQSVEGGITIKITDTGIGMEPSRIAHALEPFKQLDSRLARRFEGVGLGLPLANALVQLHQGRLSIQSVPGKGTIVAVDFPAERTVEARLAAQA